MISNRAEKVSEAWSDAYRKVGAYVDAFCAKHGSPPNCLEAIRAYSPSAAGRIDDSEKIAEQASVEWAKGGPGGVQVKIDAWVDAWREGLELVSLAR